MKKKTGLYAPQIDRYVDHFDHSFSRPCNEKSQKLLLKLFEIIEKIVPEYENTGWHLYLKADRGPISKFANYQDMLDEGEVKNRKEFIDYWHEWYPDKTVWYSFSAKHEENFYAIALNNKLIATMGTFDDDDKPSWEDYSPLIKWIIDAVEKCVEELKIGTYNTRVKKELPYDLRTGTISRKDFWNIYPEEKTDYFKDLSQKEIDEFVEFVNNQDSTSHAPKERIKSMTAHDFYTWCSLGYKANKYKRLKGFTVKKQYLNHADGRDEGLRDIDEYSPEAFHDWLHNRNTGGHPWEVCRGGNSTHIALYVHEDEKGYYASLAGKTWGKSVETIKFYLALIHNNIPVYLWDAEGLVARVLGKDCIGIVPHYIFPRYCEVCFPDEKILDFMNLPYEHDIANAIIAKAKWQDLLVTKLK